MGSGSGQYSGSLDTVSPSNISPRVLSCLDNLLSRSRHAFALARQRQKSCRISHAPRQIEYKLPLFRAGQDLLPIDWCSVYEQLTNAVMCGADYSDTQVPSGLLQCAAERADGRARIDLSNAAAPISLDRLATPDIIDGELSVASTVNNRDCHSVFRSTGIETYQVWSICRQSTFSVLTPYSI